MSSKCTFEVAWVGTCKKPCQPQSDRCNQHADLTCIACGQRATKSCDETLTSFVCGASLCATCHHSPTGTGHVTHKEYLQIVEEEKREEEATIKSRTSSEQRLHPDGYPLNLFELLKGDPSTYDVKTVYYLALTHGLMGLFPAVFVDDTQRVVTTFDEDLIKEVWKLLSPRKSHLNTCEMYVPKNYPSIGYVKPKYSGPEQEEQLPAEKILTPEEFKQLTTGKESRPFMWAPGLISDGMSQEDFLQTIEAVCRKIS